MKELRWLTHSLWVTFLVRGLSGLPELSLSLSPSDPLHNPTAQPPPPFQTCLQSRTWAFEEKSLVRSLTSWLASLHHCWERLAFLRGHRLLGFLRGQGSFVRRTRCVLTTLLEEWSFFEFGRFRVCGVCGIGSMASGANPVVRKFAPFYARVRDSEGSDSDSGMRSSNTAPSSSFTCLHRAFSSGFAPSHVVPLSESPKRELRMRSATKARRHHQYSKKHHKKQFLRLWW